MIMSSFDVVILAGGSGSRMSSGVPKPLTFARGSPILFRQLDYLLPNVTGKVVVSLGPQGREIARLVDKSYAYEQGEIFEDACIDFVFEDEPLGTAGGLHLALKKCSSDRVLVLNVDDIADINLSALASPTSGNHIFVSHPRLPFGLVMESNGKLLFDEKPLLKDKFVSIGWYFFDRKEIMKACPKRGSLERDVFPSLSFQLVHHSGYWRPLNTLKDISEFESDKLPKSLELN